MNTTNYEAQAQAFLDRFGIKFRATLSDSKVAPWSDSEHSLCGSKAKKSRHHYRVTLSRSFDTVRSDASGTHRVAKDGFTYTKGYKTRGEAKHAMRAFGPLRLTFDFWGSIADAEKLAEFKRTTPPAFYPDGRPDKMPGHPTHYDVLACISSDIHCPDTFKEWASKFGYETDSIKALQTYRRCSAFSKRLQAFFTKEEIEALQEIQ